MPTTMKIELTLAEEMLGTVAGDPEVFAAFIGDKHPSGETPTDEAESLPDADEVIEKGTTWFHKTEDGKPCIFDYVIKGFFKDACSMLRRAKPKKEQMLAFKKQIDGLIFPKPRMIVLELPEGSEPGFCERPLRAQTAQGERVALARSETVPAGTVLHFDILLLDEKLEGAVQEWLDYGALRGLGAWRNSGKGRFSYKEIE